MYPKHFTVGLVGIKHIYELAKMKEELDPDLHGKDLQGIVKMIIGTANSMGFEILEDQGVPKQTQHKLI